MRRGIGWVKVLLEDTSPQAFSVLVRITRGLTPEAKLLEVCGLIQACREFAMAGLRARHPDASPAELRLRFAALVLDRETVRKVYGWDPAVEGY